MRRSQERVNRIYDVLVFTTHPENVYSHDDPIENKINITCRLWIGRLPSNLGSSVVRACIPRGLRFRPVPPFGELYSFVYETRDMGDLRDFDMGDILLKTMILSRIAHPTTISFEYAARISEGENGRILKIQPIGLYGSGTMAFVAEPSKNYLIVENARELKILYEAYEGKPEKLVKALSYYEVASRNFDLLIRYSLISTGLEALINTDSNKATKQFKVRVPMLADCVGIKGISRTKAEKMYDLRSKIVHGQRIENARGKEVALYKEMENILRLAIREGIKNPEFADIISNRELLDHDDKWKI